MIRPLQSGQVTALVALILAVFLACASVASDFGLFQNDRRKMQNAADSAAMAGEQEINVGDGGDVVSAARGDAALNGYTDGASQITVTVNNPPQSGPHSGDSNAVEVIVSRVEPTMLLKFVGIPTIKISARAVAIEGNAPYCIMALDPTATGASFFSVQRFYRPARLLMTPTPAKRSGSSESRSRMHRRSESSATTTSIFCPSSRQRR